MAVVAETTSVRPWSVLKAELMELQRAGLQAVRMSPWYKTHYAQARRLSQLEKHLSAIPRLLEQQEETGARTQDEFLRWLKRFYLRKADVADLHRVRPAQHTFLTQIASHPKSALTQKNKVALAASVLPEQKDDGPVKMLEFQLLALHVHLDYKRLFDHV